MFSSHSHISRRELFKKSFASTAAVAAGSLVTNADLEAVSGNVNTFSKPSELKITDLRVTKLRERYFIIRIDTNQELSGYSEVRDDASATYALFLKSRILGMNPCNVDQIFRKIKQFGNHARQAGGVCGIEMACWDLAGKAWGVPCWQMLGGKFRDKIRAYCTGGRGKNATELANSLKELTQKGFTFLKTHIGIRLLYDVKDALSAPSGMVREYMTKHPFLGLHITNKGLQVFSDYAAQIRETLGWEIPVALDHFGYFGVEDCIKIARTLDKYNFAWYEDMIPWDLADQYVMLRNACTTPILTGEDIYLKEGFKDLFEKKAISICHPDIASSGGLLETKKIGDLAMEHGIAMALHMGGIAPVVYASVHCAAATENFMAMEYPESRTEPWFQNMVGGVPKPVVQQDGFIPVPDGPGLGFELNEEAVKKELENPDKEYFPPSPEWDNERSWDRIWSMGDPAYKGKRYV